MGTWDAGIFDNDEALDLVGEIVDDLQRRMEGWFGEQEPFIEDGEGLIPPIIAIMQLLSANCGAAPPKPDLIARWKTKYLKLWDEQIDDLDPEEGFKNSRREVLVRAFKQLETTSKSFWSEGTSGSATADSSRAAAKAHDEDADDDDEDADDDDDDDDDDGSAASGATDSSDKRRFEFVDGKSNKYWEIQLHGKSFTVCWGRIGTAGQTQTKDFPTDDKAQHEYQKLVDDKLKKGYEEIE